jgi:soluble lytic murein transglycosylase-like protein
MNRSTTAACAASLVLLAPLTAQAMQCRTASGQVFEAPAAAATAFSMAVKGCGEAAPARTAAPAASAPLSPLLKLYETPGASTDIRVKSPAVQSTVRWRTLGPAPRPARRARYTAAALPVAPAAPNAALYAVARAYDIDPEFLGSVVHIESGANPAARSAKGALGLMQVMPATARRFGVASPETLRNPVANMAVGAAYLKTLQRLYGNNLPLVLAAYNAGEGAVARHHRMVPPYRETANYVQNVLGRYRNAIYGRALTYGGWRTATAQ